MEVETAESSVLFSFLSFRIIMLQVVWKCKCGIYVIFRFAKKDRTTVGGCCIGDVVNMVVVVVIVVVIIVLVVTAVVHATAGTARTTE